MPFRFEHTEEWYITDLKAEALDYLDKLNLFLSKIDEEKNGGFWKWIIICLHGAIYHFMLAVLRNTDGSGVWKKEIRDKNGHIDFSKEDEMKLIAFGEAFLRLKNEKKMGGYFNSQPFISSIEFDKGMDDLNWWRNSFVHYKPKGSSIHTDNFKEAIKYSLPVLQFIVNECQRPILFEEGEREFANDVISKVRNSVEA